MSKVGAVVVVRDRVPEDRGAWGQSLVEALESAAAHGRMEAVGDPLSARVVACHEEGYFLLASGADGGVPIGPAGADPDPLKLLRAAAGELGFVVRKKPAPKDPSETKKRKAGGDPEPQGPDAPGSPAPKGGASGEAERGGPPVDLESAGGPEVLEARKKFLEFLRVIDEPGVRVMEKRGTRLADMCRRVAARCWMRRKVEGEGMEELRRELEHLEEHGRFTWEPEVSF